MMWALSSNPSREKKKELILGGGGERDLPSLEMSQPVVGSGSPAKDLNISLPFPTC
jgi:hypothetical protein